LTNPQCFIDDEEEPLLRFYRDTNGVKVDEEEELEEEDD
jgi:hypothetical protein